MKRTWTIIGVADVSQSFKWYQSLLGLPETAPAHDYFMERSCFVFTSGGPRASLVDKSPLRQAWQRPPLVLSDWQLWRSLTESTHARQPAGRRATWESQHSNDWVFAPRSWRILRHHQCAQSSV